MPLVAISAGLLHATSEQRVGLGVRLPTRMTVLETRDGLVLISPIAIDDELAAAIDARGPVHAIVAPNTMHHLHLAGARTRWPTARLLGPAALARKRPDLAFDGEPTALTAVDVVPIAGAPAFAEHVFVHPSGGGALVVTDLLFNVLDTESAMTRLVLRFVSAAFGGVKQSRLFRASGDRAARAASYGALLSRRFDALVPAHGDIVESGAHARVEAALSVDARPDVSGALAPGR
jgi:hypothetical protein